MKYFKHKPTAKEQADWEKEFEYIWQSALNRDYLIRDWEDVGREIKQFIAKQEKRKLE